MDIDSDEVGSLFGDDRERTIESVELTHYLTIAAVDDGYRFEFDDETHVLDDDAVAAMTDEYGWDSIWRAISEKSKCVAYIRLRDE